MPPRRGADGSVERTKRKGMRNKATSHSADKSICGATNIEFLAFAWRPPSLAVAAEVRLNDWD